MCLFKKVSRLLTLFAMSEGKTKAFLFGLHRSKSKPGRGSPFTASSSCAPAQSSPYWRQAIGFAPLKSLSKRKLNQTCAHTVRALVRPKAAHAKLAALCFAVVVNGLGAKLTLAEKRRLTRPWIADLPVARHCTPDTGPLHIPRLALLSSINTMYVRSSLNGINPKRLETSKNIKCFLKRRNRFLMTNSVFSFLTTNIQKKKSDSRCVA